MKVRLPLTRKSTFRKASTEELEAFHSGILVGEIGQAFHDDLLELRYLLQRQYLEQIERIQQSRIV